MNKYCLWSLNARVGVVLFKYKYKKEYKNEFHSWETYCCVDKILKNTQNTAIKKIDNYYYTRDFKNIVCFWKNEFTYNIEFEAETDEDALLRAELYE